MTAVLIENNDDWIGKGKRIGNSKPDSRLLVGFLVLSSVGAHPLPHRGDRRRKPARPEADRTTDTTSVVFIAPDSGRGISHQSGRNAPLQTSNLHFEYAGRRNIDAGSDCTPFVKHRLPGSVYIRWLPAVSLLFVVLTH